MRKHPLFGVRIFEAGKVPLEVELGEGEGLDAHRRRLIPQTIRVQAQGPRARRDSGGSAAMLYFKVKITADAHDTYRA